MLAPSQFIEVPLMLALSKVVCSMVVGRGGSHVSAAERALIYQNINEHPLTMTL